MLSDSEQRRSVQNRKELLQLTTGSQEEISRHYGIDGPGLATKGLQLLASHSP
jgi:hypothetical protein